MNSVVSLVLREGSQVEPGASVGSGLGGAMLPHRAVTFSWARRSTPLASLCCPKTRKSVGRAGFVQLPVLVIPSRPEGSGPEERTVERG